MNPPPTEDPPKVDAGVPGVEGAGVDCPSAAWRLRRGLPVAISASRDAALAAECSASYWSVYGHKGMNVQQ